MHVGCIYVDGKASSQSENEQEAKNKSGPIAHVPAIHHVGALARLTDREMVTASWF
jgi:hypothetical protein